MRYIESEFTSSILLEFPIFPTKNPLESTYLRLFDIIFFFTKNDARNNFNRNFQILFSSSTTNNYDGTFVIRSRSLQPQPSVLL